LELELAYKILGMKPKIIYPIIFSLTFSMISFCCKKFLEQPPDTFYAYPTTLPNLQAMLDNSAELNELATPSFSEASADDFFVSESNYNSVGDESRLAYIWDVPLFINGFNDWGKSYAAVYIANVALENIDKIPRTAQNNFEWDNIKGSAYFIRSYFFLQLVWTFAKAYDSNTATNDLGIVLRKSSDVNETSKRASVQECYQQILDDASQSILYLPDLANHPFRPSKAAAYSLLARTYLSMRDYSNALKFSDLALKIKNDLINYNSDDDLLGNVNQFQPSVRRFNKETIFYTEMTDVFRIIWPDKANIDTGLVLKYADNDLRRMVFFSGAGNYMRFKGMYSQNINKMFSGIATDEVFLIRAECNARMGKNNEALGDLNTLLNKRLKTGTFIPVSTSTSEETLQYVLVERRKELLMRGLRWSDIKRLNKEGYGIVLKRKLATQEFSLNPNENRYALPLPNNIIDITGMPQNPR
jgi:starch-binding outer membrane protein, SusD/RagB family